MSTDQPESPTSTIRPATMSPTIGMYPPLRGTTKTLLPSASTIPTDAEKIWFPTLYTLSPTMWSPSATPPPLPLPSPVNDGAVQPGRDFNNRYQRPVGLPLLPAHCP